MMNKDEITGQKHIIFPFHTDEYRNIYHDMERDWLP